MSTADRPRRNAPPGFATRAIHEGYDPADENGALTPPIYMTSTYAFESAEAGAAMFRGERAGYIYGRTRNPTQSILETRLASLEGGEAAVAFASGMGAISATMWTLLEAGARVVVDRILYGNSFAFFTRGLAKFGVEVVLADLTDLDAAERAITKGTALVHFETPANPDLRIVDIARIAELAHAAGALVTVDNTFASPALQRPLEHGADLVLHSATKYLGGHGDLLGGIVVGSNELTLRIRQHGLRYLTGAAISPMNAFLIQRGLKTLELRMAQHSASAEAVATLLSAHPAVARVAWPFLASHPSVAVARRQMRRGGGLVSFELKGGHAAGFALMDRVQIITRAVSLGDAETLIQHPASMTHATYSAEERALHGISDGLVRLSVGLETTEDLLADLGEALDSLT